MSNQPKLIILDDDLSICETLKVALSSIFDVSFFTNVKDAKEYLDFNPDPTLLIIDYKLKTDSGIAFYKNEIKKKGKKIPAILISGFIGQNEVEGENKNKELATLFIKVLEKPFEILELINFIKEKVLICK